MNSDYILLQEETTTDYEPTQEEIREEAHFLGIESSDEVYLWIAKEALRAPLPHHWKPYQSKRSGDIVYFNDKTGEVSENHPMDEYFRSLYQKLCSDPISQKLRGGQDRFISKEETTPVPNRGRNTQHVQPTNINSQLYITSLRSYNTKESQLLCKETHQLAIEANLYNEWMKDSIFTMKDCISRIEFLERRMKTAMESNRSIPSS